MSSRKLAHLEWHTQDPQEAILALVVYSGQQGQSSFSYDVGIFDPAPLEIYDGEESRTIALGWSFANDGDCIYEVIAWAPLPSLPSYSPDDPDTLKTLAETLGYSAES
jgi:hypothetical protein